DLDGDGYPPTSCGGTDCNDARADVNPGVPEICTDGIDNNCDGLIDFADPTCVATNDTCATPVVISAPGTYSATTRGTVRNYTFPCIAPAFTHDVVFQIDLPAAADVRLTVLGLASAGM